jgi:putative membrane protein
MNESFPIRRAAFLLAVMFAGGIALLAPESSALEEYPFSARMVQHLIIQLIVPPVILLGLPAIGAWRFSDRFLRRPVLGWFCGVGSMWLWHAPALCNAAVRSPALHLVQLLSVLVLGMVFWWPVFGPQTSHRLSPLLGVIYLFTACLGCTVLGIIIAFAPPGLYLTPGLPGSLAEWRFASPVDQRVGGLLMWVPGCLIYAAGILGLMARWYGAHETDVFASGATERTL